MLSEITRHDLEALRQIGCSPTDEEIVILNDLARKIEKGKWTSPANYPRFAVAGNIVLHQPTIAMIEWWNNYGSSADIFPQMKFTTYMFGLAHGRQPDFLDALTKPRDIRCAVKKWMKTIHATDTEMYRAMLYVSFDDFKDEEKEKKDEDFVKSVVEADYKMDMLWNMLISVSGATNIQIEQLRTRTVSDLTKMLIQANLQAGIPMKDSIAKEYIAYQMTIKQIEERHESEEVKENGEQHSS